MVYIIAHRVSEVWQGNIFSGYGNLSVEWLSWLRKAHKTKYEVKPIPIKKVFIVRRGKIPDIPKVWCFYAWFAKEFRGRTCFDFSRPTRVQSGHKRTKYASFFWVWRNSYACWHDRHGGSSILSHPWLRKICKIHILIYNKLGTDMFCIPYLLLNNLIFSYFSGG